jgi:hypothetical protein
MAEVEDSLYAAYGEILEQRLPGPSQDSIRVERFSSLDPRRSSLDAQTVHRLQPRGAGGGNHPHRDAEGSRGE